MENNGAVAQLGEHHVRNVGVGGSRPLCSIKDRIGVLDGGVADPCYPESAIPGSNSHLRTYPLFARKKQAALMIGSCTILAR